MSNYLVFVFKNLQLSKQLLWILNRSDLKAQPQDESEGGQERSEKENHFTLHLFPAYFNITYDLNVFPIKTLGKFWSVTATATEGQKITQLFHQIKILAFRV